MLTDKAFDYVKHGLDMLCLNPSDPSKWIFSNWESMMEHMQKHYKTIDTTQVAKNKLDTLTQGKCNIMKTQRKNVVELNIIYVHDTPVMELSSGSSNSFQLEPSSHGVELQELQGKAQLQSTAL